MNPVDLNLLHIVLDDLDAALPRVGAVASVHEFDLPSLAIAAVRLTHARSLLAGLIEIETKDAAA